MSFSDLLPPFDQRGMDLSLDRMMRALDALGHPCGSVPAVQVVGTNGKGSIASFIHRGLVASGIRVGLTTSPHLVDWTERIRVDHCERFLRMRCGSGSRHFSRWRFVSDSRHSSC